MEGICLFMSSYFLGIIDVCCMPTMYSYSNRLYVGAPPISAAFDDAITSRHDVQVGEYVLRGRQVSACVPRGHTTGA